MTQKLMVDESDWWKIGPENQNEAGADPAVEADPAQEAGVGQGPDQGQDLAATAVTARAAAKVAAEVEARAGVRAGAGPSQPLGHGHDLVIRAAANQNQRADPVLQLLTTKLRTIQTKRTSWELTTSLNFDYLCTFGVHISQNMTACGR
jgi:hypothetical protein